MFLDKRLWRKGTTKEGRGERWKEKLRKMTTTKENWTSQAYKMRRGMFVFLFEKGFFHQRYCTAKDGAVNVEKPYWARSWSRSAG